MECVAVLSFNSASCNERKKTTIVIFVVVVCRRAYPHSVWSVFQLSWFFFRKLVVQVGIEAGLLDCVNVRRIVCPEV